MLPGFRFLFAAIILSMSVMIFGLGAASLLRAAHEQFASIPSRPAPPEAVFAQRPEVTSPTLAMLRVDAPAGDEATDNRPATAASNQPATMPIEADKPAATPAEADSSQAAKPENPISTPAVQSNIPSSDTPQNGITESDGVKDDTRSGMADTPAADIKIASTATTAAPANEAAHATQLTDSPKVAALSDAPVSAEPVAVAKKTASDPDEAIKRRRAEQAKERRRRARRLRLARVRPATTQQFTTTTDPFSQQQIIQQTVSSSSPAPVVRTR